MTLKDTFVSKDMILEDTAVCYGTYIFQEFCARIIRCKKKGVRYEINVEPQDEITSPLRSWVLTEVGGLYNLSEHIILEDVDVSS